MAKAKSETAVEAAKPVAVVGKPIMLPKLDLRMIRIRLIGDAPLICHAWSMKAKRQMLDKQMGVATAGKEPKDPNQDFLDSLYTMAPQAKREIIPGDVVQASAEGGFGFPSVAFKNAAVTACTSLGKAITKVAARQAFHVMSELVHIDGVPSIREDMVIIGMGTSDIRFRGEFKAWSCEIDVRYNARVLTDEQIVNLFNVAGFAVGVGEWRPERDGQFGLFHVG